MGRIRDSRRRLDAELRKDREQARAASNASPFFGTGMHPNGLGGLDSDNFEAGVSGYRFDSDGNAEFNDLTLRGGIIGNDALTSPLVPTVRHTHESDFAIDPTPEPRAVATITVPSGFTRAIVTATAMGNGYNTQAFVDYLFVTALIGSDTTFGYAASNTCGTNELRTASHTATALLTGLSGSFQCYAYVTSQGGNFGSYTAANVVNLDVTVLFLR